MSEYLYFSRHQYADIRARVREDAAAELRASQHRASRATRRIAAAVKRNKFGLLWTVLNDPALRAHASSEELQLRCLVELLPELLLRSVGVDAILAAAGLDEASFVSFMLTETKGLPCNADLSLNDL